MKPTGYEWMESASLDSTFQRYSKLKSKLDREMLLIKREIKRRKKDESNNSFKSDA